MNGAPTFGEIAPRLEQLGYQPVPVPPGKKGPRCWRCPTPVPVAERLPCHAGDGVALLTANTPTIDLDVVDKELAAELQRAALKHIGSAPVRVGQAPKRALLYRLAGEPFKKVALHFKLVGGSNAGVACQIELHAHGQTITVSAIHPTTRRPYAWSTPIWQIPRADLSPLDREGAVRWMKAAGRFLETKGVRPQAQGFELHPRPPRPPAPPIGEMSDRYVAAALERAVKQVAGAYEGARSDTLNREAYGLARFAVGGRLDPGMLETALLAATTLPKHEARATIESAFRARGIGS